MRLIEPDERKDFLATLQRNGLTEGDFDLLETDTTDPKGDENCGLRGYVTIISRLSTQITKEYPIGDGCDWLQHFRKDLEAGVFDKHE
ncbi:transcriptional regulator [Caballeronia grimmiae]|uniref:transcriptional regulator n=1 Tax=Caballeronia grimmiae TaxID=1071679 RepID=UPI0038BB8C7D